MPKIWDEDRLDAWYDGSAVCIIAVGSHGDPLDLNEEQVEDYIEKLRWAVQQAREGGVPFAKPPSEDG